MLADGGNGNVGDAIVLYNTVIATIPFNSLGTTEKVNVVVG